jgi:hypothetical protein
LTCGCGCRASYRCCTPKQLLTTVGHLEVSRRYYACRGCRAKQTPWDAWAGLGAIQATPHARKMIVTVASAWSFDRASEKLADVCHLRVSDDTIERICQHEGEQAARWLRAQDPALAKAFADAPGEVELYSDGLKVNTTEGWREMRLSLLQKRESAPPVDPQQWARRVLPEASVQLAGCRIADSRLTGAMWKSWCDHLKLGEVDRLSMIGDGAAWIWEQAATRLPRHNGQWCVDVYHVAEHLHACGRTLWGEGEAARSWAKRELEELIGVGGPGYLRRLREQINQSEQACHVEAMESLWNYLHANQDRMWYAQRLREGRAIGSGAIEGACKKVGSRMKLNSARWRVRRAERFGALLCLEYARQARTYWATQAA